MVCGGCPLVVVSSLGLASIWPRFRLADAPADAHANATSRWCPGGVLMVCGGCPLVFRLASWWCPVCSNYDANDANANANANANAIANVNANANDANANANANANVRQQFRLKRLFPAFCRWPSFRGQALPAVHISTLLASHSANGTLGLFIYLYFLPRARFMMSVPSNIP